MINREQSNADLVPPPLYIGFRLFVLLGRSSGYVCSMPWKVRGTVVSWANRSVGVLSCPAPPPRPAVRRPDPTSPWYVRVLDSTGAISSDMPYMKRVYKDGINILVSSLKRNHRPANKLAMNQTFCSSVGLNEISLIRAFEESFRTVVYGALGGKRACLLLGEPSHGQLSLMPGGTRVGFLLGAPFRRRSVLPPQGRRRSPTQSSTSKTVDGGRFLRSSQSMNEDRKRAFDLRGRRPKIVDGRVSSILRLRRS